MTGMPDAAQSTPQVGRIRHIGGFVLAGVLALFVDMGVLRLLTDVVGASPLVGRPLSIAIAMVVSWWVNRTVTFAVTSRVHVMEFLKFAAVSWIAQAVNYVIFSVILLVRPTTAQEAALVAASIVSMVVSYTGFRFGVFRRPDNGRHGQGKSE